MTKKKEQPSTVDPKARIARIEYLLETATYREDVSEPLGLTWPGLKTWLFRNKQGVLGARVLALPLRKQYIPILEKPCKCCGAVMKQREGETTSNWTKRITCNLSCGSRLTARRRKSSDGVVRATNRIQLTTPPRPGVHIEHGTHGAVVTCSRCKYGFPRRTAKAAERAKALHLRVNCLEPSA